MKLCKEEEKRKRVSICILDVRHLHISGFVQRAALEVAVDTDEQVQDELRVSFPLIPRDVILRAVDLDAANVVRQIIRVRRELPARNGRNAW